MRRVIFIATASLGLAGCGSMSMPSMDFFKPAPQNVTVRLESSPPGAEARTSLGPSCKTPCSVSLPVTENFSVSYSLERFQPQTVAVRTAQVSGDWSTPSTVVSDPNPVFAEMQPIAPPKRARPPARAKRHTPKPVAAPAPAAEDAGSAFPPPPSR